MLFFLKLYYKYRHIFKFVRFLFEQAIDIPAIYSAVEN